VNASPVASLNRGLWHASLTIFTIHLTGSPSLYFRTMIHRCRWLSQNSQL